MQNSPTGNAYSLTGWLTHNQTIQAIATVCTIVAGAVLLFAALRFAWRYLQIAYRKSFVVAVQTLRRQFRRQIVRASNDIHYHFAMTVYYGAVSAIGFFVPLLISLLPLPFLLPVVAASLLLFTAYGVFFAILVAWIALKVTRRRRLKDIRWRRLRHGSSGPGSTSRQGSSVERHGRARASLRK